jgi:hypothetical protein
LTNALDGTEDHFLTREAGRFWGSLGMSGLRDSAVKDVQELHRAGKLAWTLEVIESLREPFPDGNAGTLVEGQEIDGDLSDAEKPWDSEQEDLSDIEDDMASALVAVPETSVLASSADTAEELDQAERFVKRLRTLESLKGVADQASMPQVAWHVNREIVRLHKAHHVGSEDTAPSMALQSFLRRKRESEREGLLAARKVARKKKQVAASIKAAAKRVRLAKEAKKAKAAKIKKDLSQLPMQFKAGELGQGHKTGGTALHRANRVALLERLKCRSPPLDADWEPEWGSFALGYSAYVGKTYLGAVGVFILNEVDQVMKDLGKYLRDNKGKDVSGVAGPGDAKALGRFVRKNWKKLPKPPVDPNVIVV